MPAITIAAVVNHLKPSIGPMRSFTPRRSCSIRLFRYFDDLRIRRQLVAVGLHLADGARRRGLSRRSSDVGQHTPSRAVVSPNLAYEITQASPVLGVEQKNSEIG